MKKVLSVLGLLSVLSLVLPANAAPPPPKYGHNGSQIIVSGSSYVNRPPVRRYNRYAPPPRHYGNRVFVRHGCWNNPYYNGRLGWCDDFYFRPCPPPPPHSGFSTGVFIRF